MSVIDRLNSGAIHAAARARHPERVDAVGNIHASEARARFADWLAAAKVEHGSDVRAWPADARAEYDARYVRS